jgi:hypothetical protein
MTYVESGRISSSHNFLFKSVSFRHLLMMFAGRIKVYGGSHTVRSLERPELDHRQP